MKVDKYGEKGILFIYLFFQMLIWITNEIKL
jgi:hypothetical protein